MGKRSEDLQPKLFDLQPTPADRPDVEPVPHPQQPDESNPVDFSGATEYGLPTQPRLFQAMEPDQDGEGTEAADSEVSAPGEEAPEAFLKLIARIALRTGQAPNKKEETNEGRSIPEGEQ